MWYNRFGAEALSLGDQRRLDRRKREEFKLRRQIQDAKREAVILQRAQAKEQRIDNFYQLKQDCLEGRRGSKSAGAAGRGNKRHLPGRDWKGTEGPLSRDPNRGILSPRGRPASSGLVQGVSVGSPQILRREVGWMIA